MRACPSLHCTPAGPILLTVWIFLAVLSIGYSIHCILPPYWRVVVPYFWQCYARRHSHNQPLSPYLLTHRFTHQCSITVRWSEVSSSQVKQQFDWSWVKVKMTETPSHLLFRPHLLVGFCLVTRLPPQHQESDQETMFECCDDQKI